MNNSIIIYETYYGTSKKCAEILSLIIGNSCIYDINDVPENLSLYKNVLFIYSFHGYETACEIKKYINDNLDKLHQKKIGLIGVGLRKDDLDSYNKGIIKYLKATPDLIGFIEGELIVSKLTKSDKDILIKFLETQNMELKDMGQFSIKDVANEGLKIKEALFDNNNKMDNRYLKEKVDEFINSHNTCTLCTHCTDTVRGTPIEYIYYNNNFYFISEGGIKFYCILQNPNVSLSIYDSYTTMQNINGIQITGVAKIVDYKSDKYNSILKLKNLDIKQVLSLPINLNMIEVRVSKFEFLCSSFKKNNYNSKQILELS